MIVTFCGHSDEVYSKEIREKIKYEIEILINQGADTFLLGGYGEFDMLCAGIVKELKNKYQTIKSVLVIPYLNVKYDTDYYDYTEYPDLEKVPKRFAILKRNEYMVNKSDIIIAYIKHEYGGAYKTFTFAKRKNKKIIIFP